MRSAESVVYQSYTHRVLINLSLQYSYGSNTKYYAVVELKLNRFSPWKISDGRGEGEGKFHSQFLPPSGSVYVTRDLLSACEIVKKIIISIILIT